MAALNNKDVRGFEKFADLVRVTVVKLKAEERTVRWVMEPYIV